MIKARIYSSSVSAFFRLATSFLRLETFFFTTAIRILLGYRFFGSLSGSE